jgi:RNA polymerase subunit RPABC4/transcription elongation factor Spt4
MLRCEECGADSETGQGWRGYLTVDDERSSIARNVPISSLGKSWK